MLGVAKQPQKYALWGCGVFVFPVTLSCGERNNIAQQNVEAMKPAYVYVGA
jgi:hypothetical protein